MGAKEGILLSCIKRPTMRAGCGGNGEIIPQHGSFLRLLALQERNRWHVIQFFFRKTVCVVALTFMYLFPGGKLAFLCENGQMVEERWKHIQERALIVKNQVHVTMAQSALEGFYFAGEGSMEQNSSLLPPPSKWFFGTVE